MNKIYHSIWNELTGTFVAVAEIAKSRGKRVGSTVAGAKSAAAGLFGLTPLAAGLMAAGLAQAAPPVPTQLPTNGNVVAGQASISQANAVMTVNQSSNRAVVDWSSFNVGSSATVNFVQPSASSATLNRVLDANPSQILGRINANGQVFLTNASGIYFGKDATVNVGALTATTHSIDNADFMAGNLNFSRNGATGSVVNDGNLNAALGGYIALLAPEVRNNGVVVAKMGTVALAAGEAYELQFGGSRLANVRVGAATIAALVENKQAVQAPGGLIILSAQAANRLQGGVVNNSGSIEATGLIDHGGTVRLSASDSISHTGSINADAQANSTGNGGTVILMGDLANKDSVTQVNGRISARGGDLGGDGGFVETSAGTLKIGSATRVDTRAPQGKGGQWLLDPANFTIGIGGDMTGADLSAQLATTGVTIQTDATGNTAQEGSIYVNDAVSWNAVTMLKLDAHHSIYINQPVDVLNANARLEMYYGNASNPINANSRLQINAPINMLPTASLRIGNYANVSDYTIVNNLDDLRNAIRSNQNANIALGNNLDETNPQTGNAITPLSGFGTSFTGQFEGLGHTISNISLTYPGVGDIGLFGRLDGAGAIRNITIDNAQVAGLNNVGVLVGRAGGDYQAGLTTIYNSHVVNSAVTASDTALGNDANVGGLVGNAWGGLIDSSSARSVTVAAGGNNAGGLVGQISQAILKNSDATGSVSSPSGNNVGGLVGVVGLMNSPISNSYAQVNVDGGTNVGGLFGSISSLSVENSFYPIEGVTIRGSGMAQGQHLVTAYGIYSDQWTSWRTNNGLGTPDSVLGAAVGGYYIVNTDAQLKALLGYGAQGYGAYKFKLGQDFDVSTLSNGYDWHLPVFVAAELNGGGYAIKNMAINQPFNDYVGLIGKLHPASDLTHLTISDATIAGRNFVGGAVGFAYGNPASNPISQVLVTVDTAATSIQGGTGPDNLGVGGLVGSSERGVINSVVGLGVAVSGNKAVGGLIGYLDASDKTVSVSSNTANASVSGAEQVGGLIGYVDAAASVLSSDVSLVSNTVGGSVTGTGDNVGGLVGFAYGYGSGRTSSIAVRNNTTNAVVSGQNNVGGLVGFVQGYGYGGTASIQISGNTTRGSTQGTGTSVGGLVGHAFAGGFGYYGTYGTSPNSIDFSNNQTFGQTTGNTRVGGLVGYAHAGQSTGSTSSISFSGDVAHGDVQGGSQVGGLIGEVFVEGINSTATVTVSNAVAHGAVTSREDEAGGLVGRVISTATSSGGYGYGSGGAGAASFTVSGSTSYGAVQGGRNTIGGLIGYAEANGSNGNASIDISNSTAKGTVSGINDVGGLVGGVSVSTGVASISGSEFAGVSVTGTGDRVGGLVGSVSVSNDGGSVSIDDSHASNTALQVTGNDRVGGLIGNAEAIAATGNATIDISNSTAKGAVSGNNDVGGLIGHAYAYGSYGSATINVTNSKAYGGVIGSGQQVGGLVGYVSASGYGFNYTGAVNITGSEFMGTSVTGLNAVGGLTGAVSAGSYGSVSIDDSHARNPALQVTGNDHVGGLVGRADANGQYGNATIDIRNSTAKGAVSGSYHVGGLIGAVNAQAMYGGYGPSAAVVNITASQFDGSVTGLSKVGGLIGSVYASGAGYGSSYTGTVNINHSGFTGTSVSGTGSEVGGLVGSAFADATYGMASITISNSAATGSISGDYSVGGLVGASTLIGGNYGGAVNISHNTFTGTRVQGTDGVGGLVGTNNQGTVANNSVVGLATSWMEITGHNNVGGLIGSNANYDGSGNYGAVTNNTVLIAKVQGVDAVGGLIGLDESGSISGNWVGKNRPGQETEDMQQPRVSVVGESSVGGLIGRTSPNPNTFSSAQINDSKVWAAVSGQTDVGGLIGADTGSVVTSSEVMSSGTGSIKGVVTSQNQTIQNIGGLIGHANGTTIDNSNVSVVMDITDGSATTIMNVGGMIGYGEGITVSPTSPSSTGRESSVNSMMMVGATGTATVQGIGGAIGKLGLSPDFGSSSVSMLDMNGSMSVGGVNVRSVGGTVGQSAYASISEVSSKITSLSVPTGASKVGGLIGSMNETTVTDGYADLTFNQTTSLSQTGGLVGLIDGNSSMTKTYVMGIAPSLTGALVGAVGPSWTGAITSSYYLNTLGRSGVKGVGNNNDVTGVVESKTAAQLNDINTFTGWTIVDTGISSSPMLPFDHTWILHSLASSGPVYVRLQEGSSTYGNAPGLTYKIYDAATGGNEIPAAYTGATVSGSVVWDTALSASTNVGTYSLAYVSGIALGSNSAYTLNSGSSMNWVITPRPLNVAVTKTYDGNANYTAGYVFTGMVNGNAAPTVTGGAVSVSSKNVGSYTSFVTNTLTLSDSNYTVGSVAAGITAKTLTVSGTTVVNKVYDGSTTATLSGGTLQGVVGSDAVTLVEAGTFANKNVGTGKAVTAEDTLGGGDAANYTLTQPTGLSADITAKVVFVAGLSVRDKVYDGSTSAVVNDWGTLTGVVGSETLVLDHGTAAFSDANVGAGKTVTATGYSLADGSQGGLARNYQLAASTATTTASIGTQVQPATEPIPLAPPAPVPAQQALPKAAAQLADASAVSPGVSASQTVATDVRLNSSITVSVVRSPSAQQTGVIAVSLPKDLAVAGAGFSFPLPAQLLEAAPQALVRVTLPNGNALPAWLKFNAESKTFSASAVPEGAFPIQLLVHVGTTTSTIEISERVQ